MAGVDRRNPLACLVVSCLLLAGCGGEQETETAEATADVNTPTATTAAEAPTAASTAAEPQPAAAAEAPEITWLAECGSRPKSDEFRCGEIKVPLERADPALGTTTIRFAARPPTDGGDPAGAIYAVEGGPGYASTGTAFAFRNLFGPLLGDRELVLIDQRGIGKSDRINCPDVQGGAGPIDVTLAECARRLGPLASSYRTAAAADDIEDVRRALGHDRITLYGDSYGTFLGQSYAFRHGETLEALVLDSAYPAFGEDPWYPSLPQTAIEAMSTACERDPKCEGDAGKRLKLLTGYLRETGRGTADLIDSLIDSAYGPPATYLAIDHAGTRLRQGKLAPWRRLTRDRRPAYLQPRRYSHTAELVFGCNDYPMIWDVAAAEPERRAQLERSIREYDPGAFLPFTTREIAMAPQTSYLECLTWPAPSELYEPAVDPDSDQPTTAPVLVVSGELDDVTTPDEGAAVAGEFPDARQVVIRNAGHTDALYYTDGRAAQAIRKFLRGVYGRDEA